MIDGLALGESTPGPLIMVVAFVGFVGGWSGEILGPGTQILAGTAGACVATLFTFLPSFVFIFAGAPFIETTHGDLRFTGPLTAITAAVVGVILNLAMFFAWHVFWPQGMEGGFDAFAAVLAVAALAALIRWQLSAPLVLVACGASGALWTLVRPML
jgi:chromate transporter